MLVLITFFVLMVVGFCPSAMSSVFAGMIGMFQIGGLHFLNMAAQRFFAGLNLFTFMAMPFFILAGDIDEPQRHDPEDCRLRRRPVGYLRGGTGPLDDDRLGTFSPA